MFNWLAEGYKIKVYKKNDWFWKKIEVHAKTDLVKNQPYGNEKQKNLQLFISNL